MVIVNQPFCNNTLPQLFEEQASKSPDNIAVIYNDTILTYKELNERANQLAHYLIYKFTPGTLIGLCISRSDSAIITMLAILKAGAIYVPIDPIYPDKRISYILEDINTKVVLTDSIHTRRLNHIISKIRNKQIEVINIQDNTFKTQLAAQPEINLETFISNTDVAYIIYTSGTTGNPKGVVIEHRSIINRIVYLINTHRVNAGFRIAAKTSYGFDPSLREIFLALLAGAILLVIPEDISRDPHKLLAYCIEREVHLLIFVPSQLATFLDSIKALPIHNRKLVKIGFIYSCGERLTKNLALELKFYLPKVIIKNQYGPTECCLFCFEFDLSHYNINTYNNIPIGRPILNTQCYVLSDDLTVLHIGTVGELYIGGIGLAREYLNLPELTTKKFIYNLFQTEEEKLNGENTRLYKTGDLVRWLPDGNLEYIGRNDNQVKIRGCRVELGEIENTLLQHKEVKQAVVLAREHRNGEDTADIENKSLMGYYTSESKLHDDDIFGYLHDKLPGYMVPNDLIHLHKLPLTINGKIDREALLELPSNEYDEGQCVAPRDDMERQIFEVWTTVLGIDENKISIYDDFFKLGGNSILAIRLVSKLNKKLNKCIHISIVFEENTIEKIAKYLKKEDNTLLTFKEKWII